MSSLSPKAEYSETELSALYPKDLRLLQVQIVFRHGERSPLQSIFQNAGLPPLWPYCSASEFMQTAVMIPGSPPGFEILSYHRRLETDQRHDRSAASQCPRREGICIPGELTDKGRQTTWDLGQRLRRLYVERLQFMPAIISDPTSIYLRSTSWPRAIDSLVQVFGGMYPSNTRAETFGPPDFVLRNPREENLLPNTLECERLKQITEAFAKRAAEKWDNHEDMAYLTKIYGKWLSDDSKRVSLHGKTSLLAIMDTVDTTDAHGSLTRLPKQMYDPKAREIMDRIVREEYWGGYLESHEYRTLAIGSLLGDMTHSMMESIRPQQQQRRHSEDAHGRPFELYSCHDSSLVAILSSLGAFKGPVAKWPSFSSHIALELFVKESSAQPRLPEQSNEDGLTQVSNITQSSGLWRFMTRLLRNESTRAVEPNTSDYYVRLKYNDDPLNLEVCRPEGNHFNGDETLCTMDAFKAIVDKITPVDWSKACRSNLHQSPFPPTPELPGF